ncbi:MAG: cobyrinate a,c-diamide synthase [Cyanothece sp. SIO1E1]|nr:cobyrinate a,c-diamide synthase [Cyanothece sp. SIO1E1]
MTLVIAGERSGVGKTTVVIALLAYLCDFGKTVQSFKVGPDYIDPMFHRILTGRACRTLDPILTSEAYAQECFCLHTQAAHYALVEGVMGLFDGASANDDWASTAHIARLLNLPILLVLDCSRLSRSIAAIAHGYTTFDPRLKIAGVVLNRVGSDRHLELLQTALEPLNLPILGVLQRQDNITIPDRHLGLVPTAEIPELNDVIQHLTELGKHCFDWSQLLPLLRCDQHSAVSCQLSADEELSRNPSPIAYHLSPIRPRIAVALDRAFSFYYPENLEMLAALGAELMFWSPLTDLALPARIQGLYLGGGFPEVFAQQLSENCSARMSVRAAIESGLPTYAECGGLMYLCEQIIDFENQAWPMVGVLPTTTCMGQRLTLGYRRAIALQDSPLMKAGTKVWGHEFHRSSLKAEAAVSLYQLRGYNSNSSPYQEGWQRYQVHASYVHLHWGTQPAIAARFVDHCAGWNG